MKNITTIFAAAILLLTATAKSESFGGNEKMNGYKLSDYKDFEKKWKLVTTRYRKDTGELRFTYANPSAWKTLISGKTDYPDGAVFAKIGIITEEDEMFPSSSIPSGAKRYQLMVRNKKKHKDDDGWGYALFDQKGVTFNEDPKVKIASCVACHKVAASRGFVFSQPMQFAVGEPSMWLHQELKSQTDVFFQFETKNKTALPLEIQKIIPGDQSEVNYMIGAIQKNMFQGTIDEIRPVLAKKTNQNSKPSILVNEKGDRYSLVYSIPLTEKCKIEKNAKSFMAIFSIKPEIPTAPAQRRLEFCF